MPVLPPEVTIPSNLAMTDTNGKGDEHDWRLLEAR